MINKLYMYENQKVKGMFGSTNKVDQNEIQRNNK